MVTFTLDIMTLTFTHDLDMIDVNLLTKFRETKSNGFRDTLFSYAFLVWTVTGRQKATPNSTLCISTFKTETATSIVHARK